MPTADKPKPCKRFGTFGDPDRVLTQVEREFYANMARMRKKRTQKKEKPPAEGAHRKGKEKRGNESEMSREKSTDKLFALRKRSLTPADAASRSALPAPSSPPRDNRLAVLSAVCLLDRAAPLVEEPDRRKPRDRAASECVSSCTQHMPEPRRGFGFNDQHAPESLCKPGDSILLPSRYQSARSGHENTPRWQRQRRAPKGLLVSAGNSPDHTPDVPLETGLVEKLQRMKVLSVPQTASQEFPKRGNSNPSSVMSGGGDGENVDLSRVAGLSDDKAGVEGRIGMALGAHHREYFSGGSFRIHGLTDEQMPTLEVLAAIEKLLKVRKESKTTSMRTDRTTKQEPKEEAATQKRRDHGNAHSAPTPKPKATASAGKGSQARASSFPSLIRSALQAAAAAITPARTSPSLSRAEARCAAPSPPLAQPLPALHANDAGRHAQKGSSETRRQASRQPPACVSGKSRGASSSRSRKGGFPGPFCCINGKASRHGLAEKMGRRAAQGALRKDVYTQTKSPSGATAVDEACRQYVEQCRREEQELKKLIEWERQRAGTAPGKVSAAIYSAALSGTTTGGDSAVAASSSPARKVAGVSAFSHHRPTSATSLGAPTEERVSPRSSSADRTKRRRSPACRNGRPTPLSCTDLGHLNTNKSTRQRSGSRPPAHAYPFLAGMADDACDASSESTPSAQPKIAFAGAGGGGVSPNKAARMTAVTIPTPMREAGGSRSRPVEAHLQDPDNLASFTAALFYEPSSAEESHMSSRAISVVDISSTANHCGTSESVSVAEETVQEMVKAYSTADSPQMNTLHENAGARSDPTRQRANSVGVATEPSSSPSAGQRESRQGVLSGAPVHTASFDGSGIGVSIDDAYETGSDLYVFPFLLECRGGTSPQQQNVHVKTPLCPQRPR
ncbi:hypothetical protein conserved [Leishmania donovani]|uniref:Uncharacterized protein n=3 Tax=Leishmania donovani species complex TaxID=38574 RepID=A4I6Z7_LEIIN|nr:hypothetical protein, unknown function [Leishmania infantum JPCM5]CAC9520471.1 hypothetical_protein_-_conserved [Leishmania infantum]CAJ1991421.1 hypothetical protein conserved [Leishmania donovani]CAM70574.1 hypothetical protein, unknown function [Leishmania infantum JPCM5]SUZ44451.1 hypothetical_protein_-_conserved [Leishmania infantum]VDZ47264.1 hypothetical_protein_conserved [Leishmania donovani]|eukprot:XP_001467516.1 hypothetical protein, unknown function [Leishmania infantum JPCM5]